MLDSNARLLDGLHQQFAKQQSLKYLGWVTLAINYHIPLSIRTCRAKPILVGASSPSSVVEKNKTADDIFCTKWLWLIPVSNRDIKGGGLFCDSLDRLPR